MTEDPNGKSADPKGAVPFLDRAVEIKFALLVTSFALAVDVAGSLVRKKSLVALNWSLNGPDINSGLIIVFAAAYLLFMSFGSAVLMAIFLQIAELVGTVWHKIVASLAPTPPSNYFPPPSTENVSQSELKREALERNDSFLYGLAEKSEDVGRAEKSALTTNALVSTACIALFAADRYFPHTLFTELQESWNWLFYLAWALIALPIWPYLSLDPSRRRWVFYPPLARENYARWRKNRDDSP